MAINFKFELCDPKSRVKLLGGKILRHSGDLIIG